MEDKTNVMRILDQKKIEYKEHTYLNTGAIGGQEVAEALGEDANRVFKTLVTVGKTGNHYGSRYYFDVLFGVDFVREFLFAGQKVEILNDVNFFTKV